jgi:DNA repair photolyase
MAPVIPGLTDSEIPRVLERAAEAGATSAGYVVLRLPHGVKEIFEAWLEAHYPDRKEKILGRLRALREGKLYRAEWGKRMSGTGVFAEQIESLFEASQRRYGLERRSDSPSTAAFRRPKTPSDQGDLFG